jgi:hypothetical protein
MNPDISRILTLCGGFGVLQPVLQSFAADELAPSDGNMWERAHAGDATIQEIGKVRLGAAKKTRRFWECQDLNLARERCEVVGIQGTIRWL